MDNIIGMSDSKIIKKIIEMTLHDMCKYVEWEDERVSKEHCSQIHLVTFEMHRRFKSLAGIDIKLFLKGAIVELLYTFFPQESFLVKIDLVKLSNAGKCTALIFVEAYGHSQKGA